ncbi:MAG: hypothetical protein ACOC3J_02325 [Gemmatimonadota bacterium]
MILRLSFEEITAMNSAARRMLGGPGEGGVLAPPAALAALESRVPLEGDISLATVADQLRLLRAVDLVLAHLKRRMDALVVEQYVGSEDAVNAYFDYANVLAVRAKLAEVGEEMEAILELITGESGSGEADIVFPD